MCGNQTPRPLLTRHPASQSLAECVQDGALLNSTRVVRPNSTTPAATTAGQARDDDSEERDNGVDNGLACGGDGVDNGHDAVADCAEDGLDLMAIREKETEHVSLKENVRMILRRPCCRLLCEFVEVGWGLSVDFWVLLANPSCSAGAHKHTKSLRRAQAGKL